MSRREEVEAMVDQILSAYDVQREATLRLAELALESIPASYVPREEVTEGWWSCRPEDSTRREMVWYGETATTKEMLVWPTGEEDGIPLDGFTDFLRVPAWLVEGIET